MAVDMFLKIAGIEGESQDVRHKGEIDIRTFGWAGESASGRAARMGQIGWNGMERFTFSAFVGRETPKLIQAFAHGEKKEAVLTCRKAGDKPMEYLIVKFTNARIAAYRIEGNREQPLITFALEIVRVAVEYHVQRDSGGPGGSVEFSWDLSHLPGS